MFYSQFILAKKGPLGTIWIAAHLERKLRKNQVADTDIGVSVDSILFPDVPIALRLSSHLLLGVVRIYSRKVNYLFDDCSEALLKVKQAFRSTAVDLPPEESRAPYHSITLPETFDLDDFELPDSDIFQGNYVDHHVSSREQITLQDTMDGVVYSTSQFGLDERFGDGETSCLELDEELFLDNAAPPDHATSSANPQSSVEPMTPVKQDEHHQGAADLETMIEGADGDTCFMDYAQAPSTPGLVEPPNLSNIQDTSACDDHMESEDHHLAESAANENPENAPSKADSQSENKLVTDSSLPVGLADQVGGISLASEQPEGVVLADSNDNIVTSSADVSAVDNQRPDSMILESRNLPVPEGANIEQQILPSVDVSSDKVTEGNLGKSCSPADAEEENIGKPETQSCPETKDATLLNHAVDEKEAISDIQVLRPCNAGSEQPGTSDFRVEHSVNTDIHSIASEFCAADSSGRKEASGTSGTSTMVQDHIGQSHNKEPTLCEDEQSDPSKSKDQTAPVETNTDNLTDHDLPAPEKMLSAPEGVVDLSRNKLVEATPGDLRVDEGGDGSKFTSGKKRSFTESTLTEQSFNSVESSRMVRMKRVGESVPDDDDLLSSILVGRRSSILKVKPTPTPSEITSMRRSRSVLRPSASKRKVLMDDTMVLHGDTIRQQLTSTEDIRRVRKKAPCTQVEMSMIHKQFLEDEIFSEPIYTATSIELASLYNYSYDLSRIKISQNDPRNDSLSTAADTKVASEIDESGTILDEENNKNVAGPEVIKGSGLQGTYEYVIGEGNAEAGFLDTHKVTEDKQGEENVQNLEENVNQSEVEPGIDVAENDKQAEILQDIAEGETGERSLATADAKNADVTDGAPLSCTIDQEVVLADSSNRASEIDTSAGVDELGVCPDQQADTMLVEIDNSGMDISSTKMVDANDPTDKDDDIAPVGSKITADDAVFMEVTQDGGVVETETLVNNEEVDYSDRNLTSNGIIGDQHYVDGSCPEDVNLNPEKENLSQYGSSMFRNEADMSSVDLGDHEINYPAMENNIEFLNVDDDEVVEDADDYITNAEEVRFTENSGWSSRTRAVAKYLQTVFEKEAEHGKKTLPMDNLLVGKTRKEASRMFFETLVLKTRDYIDVEQQNPFVNITIKPRTKLMKSDF